MDLSNILVISGKPDLSELVSQTKSGAVVMNLVTGQKYPVFKNERISSLGEIRLFTESDERPLEAVMQAIYRHLEGKATAFEPKKAEGSELAELLGAVVPDYDRERVHTSDMKKLFAWYNILCRAGKITLDEEEKKEE